MLHEIYKIDFYVRLVLKSFDRIIVGAKLVLNLELESEQKDWCKISAKNDSQEDAKLMLSTMRVGTKLVLKKSQIESVSN